MSEPKIYLAAPISNGDNPYKWHDTVRKKSPEIEWVNPFELHGTDACGEEIYKRDLKAIRSSDGVLLRRIDSYEVCGAYIESGIANGCGLPTVVHNDANTPPPKFLDWHANNICESVDSAINSIKKVLE